MSIQRTCGVDIFFPASGSVVEARSLTTRAESSAHIGNEYVTLTIRRPEVGTSTPASGGDWPISNER
jgi:hypothetical protein